jgi:hypothetical protein
MTMPDPVDIISDEFMEDTLHNINFRMRNGEPGAALDILRGFAAHCRMVGLFRAVDMLCAPKMTAADDYIRLAQRDSE